jgi:hypothetical protein
MKIKIFIILLFFPLVLLAQKAKTNEMPRFRLGITAGMGASFGNNDRPAYIRQSQSYYYDYDYSGNIFPEWQNLESYYFGLKPEYMLNRKIAVAAGLQFVTSSATLRPNSNRFLWKVSEDATNTNFLKIKEISQQNHFLGIPLEVKFFPKRMEGFVRHYFIVGTSFNFRVSSSKNDIVFETKQMEKYTSEVSSQLRRPNSFHGSCYAGFGLKIGKPEYPIGNIEIQFPVLMFGNGNLNAFIKTKDTFGIAIQTALQIPVFTKCKLEY